MTQEYENKCISSKFITQQPPYVKKKKEQICTAGNSERHHVLMLFELNWIVFVNLEYIFST